jgi:hypothetical protein
MTLAEHSNAPIDVRRVMNMLLIHDNVKLDQVRARNSPIGDGATALWTYMSRLLDEAVQAGHLTV